MNQKSKNLYTVNDIFTNWKQSGIFTIMSNNYDVPWDKTRARFLDWMYHGNRSGDKFVAPLVLEVAEDDGTITDDNIITLCGVAFMKYGSNWARLFAADNSTYNPIENYSMTEEGEDTAKSTSARSSTESNTLTHNTTDTSAGSSEHSTTEDTTGNSETEIKKLVYGFDSATGRDSESETDTTTNTGTREASGNTSANTTETHTGTDKTDITHSGNDTTDNTTTHKFKRSGNIGVTTSAQMIEQEHNLWGDWSIYEKIFKDIDDIFTIGIFADKNDNNGRYVIVKQYTLPQATAAALGGVKAAAATESQTTPVGIRGDGTLVYSTVAGANVSSVNGKQGDVILTAADVDAPSLEVYNTDITDINKQVLETLPDDIAKVKTDIESAGYYGPNNAPPYPVTSVYGRTGDVRRKVPSDRYRVVNGTLDGLTTYDARVGGILVLMDLSEYIGHTIEVHAFYDYAYPMAIWHEARGKLNDGVILSDIDLTLKTQFTLTTYYANNYTTGREGVRIWRQVPKEAEPFIISAIIWQSSTTQYPDLLQVDLYIID